MKVLILCTGNSCRSQMAEGLLQSMAPEWEVYSAGTKPTQEVHPLAIQVMEEAHLSLLNHYPKGIQRFSVEKWDILWTVCSGAKETCPSFSGVVSRRIHIGFDDPTNFEGSPEKVLEEFRRVRNEIKRSCKDIVFKSNWLATDQ